MSVSGCKSSCSHTPTQLNSAMEAKTPAREPLRLGVLRMSLIQDESNELLHLLAVVALAGAEGDLVRGRVKVRVLAAGARLHIAIGSQDLDDDSLVQVGAALSEARGSCRGDSSVHVHDRG